VPASRRLASTGVRLALIQAAILIGAFAAASSLTSVATRTIIHKDAETHVTAEIATLSDEYAAGGRDRLAASIQVRSKRLDGFYSHLISPGGVLLAGDLPPAPAVLGWSYIDDDAPNVAASSALHQDLVVFTRRLPDGSILAVGQALGERLRAELVHTLFWCAVIATLGGLAVSLLVYGGVVRRVDAVADAAREASRGRLDARAPVRKGPAPDDIDDLAEAFNHMLGQINTLLQNIRQVSADIAHDLRTPLTRVRQKLDLLQRARSGDAALVRDINSVNADIAETLRTFDAMLRLAEIESGQDGLTQVLDLAETAARVAEAYRPDAEDGGRRLEASLQPALVLGDGELLTQAMANMLDNALRHTPEGTRICLRTGLVQDRPYLAIADNGPGVPEAHRAAVLQRFFRLERSRTTSGTGLGLAIVAAIAHRHKATLELLDAGPGLEVRLTFPPLPAPAGPPGKHPRPAEFPAWLRGTTPLPQRRSQ
jgi:signal transduction histidine kinase